MSKSEVVTAILMSIGISIGMELSIKEGHGLIFMFFLSMVLFSVAAFRRVMEEKNGDK